MDAHFSLNGYNGTKVMLTALILFAIPQYGVVATPNNPSDVLAAQQRAENSSKPDFKPFAATSAVKPAIVPANEMLTPKQVLDQGRLMSTQVHGVAYRSALPVPLLRNCRITSTNPAGVFRTSDGSMNGRVTFAQCSGFVASVSVFDLGEPTKPSMEVAHHQANDDAMVKGGYRMTRYLRATDGREEVVVYWLNPTARRRVTIYLYPEKGTIADVAQQGFQMLEMIAANVTP